MKIFGLGKSSASGRGRFFERFYRENRHLATQRAIHGTLLNLIPTDAYYPAYSLMLILLRGLAGTLMVGAFSRARNIMASPGFRAG